MYHNELPLINPELVLDILADTIGVIYLDSSMLHENLGRYSFIMLNPLETFEANGTDISQAIDRWQHLFELNKINTSQDMPPFSAGLAGYFSYDLGKQLELLPTLHTKSVPDYHLGLYNQVIAFDLILHKCHVMVTKVAGYELDYVAQMQHLLDLYQRASKHILSPITQLPHLVIESNFTKNEYKICVERAREYIANGDIFEVNLSQCYSAPLTDNYRLDLLYRKLRTINPAPFSAYLNLGGLRILSSSPERFLSIRDRHIESRPIKGTIKRSSNLNEDHVQITALQNSKKDIAENIMIVDLVRNDLGKVCVLGSVQVTQLCRVESFTNVHHLVSVVEADLAKEHSIFDVIGAAFPGGSITGAPKIRSMQIIEELERCCRGIYCGSIGYFSFNGNVDMSIAIRTIVSNNNNLSFNVGGAITLDSDPESEYYETLIKSQKLVEAINGV